jgi:sugar phosphate isomerase/epimerase
MRLGYSTATAGIYDLDEAFRFAASLGLDFVELNHDTCDFLPQAQLPEKVKALVNHSGIGVSVHLPFIDLNIASLIPAIRKASVEQTLRGLEYAHAIGASCGVLHTGKVFIYQPVPLQASLDALHTSLSQLSGSSVPIVLENLALYNDGLIREPEMLKTLTQTHHLKNCLDFGHACIESQQSWRLETLRGEDMIQKYIHVLGQDITHLHLCNNDGLSDLHQATPQGVIAFERYADYLANFKSVCLEVAGGKDQVRRSAEHIRSLLAIPA